MVHNINTNRHLVTHKSDIYKCIRCGMCRSKYNEKVRYVCPVREHTAGFEHYFSRGRILIARGILEGDLTYSRDLVDVLNTCTMCGNCVQQCGAIDFETGRKLIESDKITEVMRADIYDHHPEMVNEGYKLIITSTQNYGNPWMQPRSARIRWTKGLKIKDINKEKAEILFYTGCTAPLNPELQAVTINTFRVLEKSGVDFGILKEHERCCGSVQKRAGALDAYEKLARDNINQFNELGVKKIITTCAGCYRTFKEEYPEFGSLDFEVLHTSEFLEHLLREGMIEFANEMKMKVTYHDPCHLGRHVGVYDPPRNILRAIPGLELVEMYPNRENSWCCGGGGGVRTVFPDLAVDIASDKLEMAKEVGAEVIVTACPFCENNIMLAAKKANSDIKIVDLTLLVSDAMIL